MDSSLSNFKVYWITVVLMNFYIDLKENSGPSPLEIGKDSKEKRFEYLSNSNYRRWKLSYRDKLKIISKNSFHPLFLSSFLFLEMLWPVCTCLCFSVRRHSRTVLRPDEVIRGGRITLHDKVSLPRRLCRQGLFQYRGEFENSSFPRLSP